MTATEITGAATAAPDQPPALAAALGYAALGWPVLPVEARGKAPLTRHGVKDASIDREVIEIWAETHPDCNWGVATGAPGPTVLDIDNLWQARRTTARIAAGTPMVATPRGRHYYFAGTERGTIALGYGELRAAGSYVVVPPSIGADGKVYVWATEPNGPLFPVPSFAVPADRQTVGGGDQQAPARRVRHGQRHVYLTDFAVRLARAGVLDERRMLAHLRLEFEQFCEPDPPPGPKDLYKLARWAVRTRIAQRERAGQ